MPGAPASDGSTGQAGEPPGRKPPPRTVQERSFMATKRFRTPNAVQEPGCVVHSGGPHNIARLLALVLGACVFVDGSKQYWRKGQRVNHFTDISVRWATSCLGRRLLRPWPVVQEAALVVARVPDLHADGVHDSR